MQAQQPEHTKIVAKHYISYKGFTFEIEGKHELKYALRATARMRFFAYLICPDGNGSGVNLHSKVKLTERLDYLIKTREEKIACNTYYNSRKGLSPEQVITHPDFAYARYAPNISVAAGGCDLGVPAFTLLIETVIRKAGAALELKFK